MVKWVGGAGNTFVAFHDDPDPGPDAFVDEFCHGSCQLCHSFLRTSSIRPVKRHVPRGRSWEAMVSVSCCFWEFRGRPESTHGQQLQWGCLCMSHLGVFVVSSFTV